MLDRCPVRDGRGFRELGTGPLFPTLKRPKCRAAGFLLSSRWHENPSEGWALWRCKTLRGGNQQCHFLPTGVKPCTLFRIFAVKTLWFARRQRRKHPANFDCGFFIFGGVSREPFPGAAILSTSSFMTVERNSAG